MISITILIIIIFTILFISLENIFFKINNIDNLKKIKISFLVILLTISSLTGIFFHQSKGVKFRYLLNQELNSEYIFKSIHYNASQEINEESCIFVCKKLTGNNKTILLFGDHAGDFEHELTEILNKKK